MSLLPPRHLCIAGALCIALGVEGVTEMIASLIAGGFSFNLDFVGIPIGYGILIGRASSRRWALVFAMLGFAFAAVKGGGMAYDLWKGVSRLPSADGVYNLEMLSLYAGCCLYVIVALMRGGQREWFGVVQEKRTAAKSLVWAVMAVTAVLLASQRMTDEWVEETYVRMEPFRVRISAYNAETGEATPINYQMDRSAHGELEMRSLPEVHVGYSRGPHGEQLEFTGFASRSFEVTLKSEDFEDKVIALAGKLDFDIRVPMQPLIHRKPKAGAETAPAPAGTRPDSD